MNKRILQPLIALALLVSGTVQAQTLRFYAKPYRVNSGDAVTLVYFETTNSVPRASIATCPIS